MGDLKSIVASLKNSAAALNAASTEISNQVSDLEVFLSEECHIGIEASIVAESIEQEAADSSYSWTDATLLGYSRFAGRFRITVTFVRDDDYESASVKPWSDCSRDVKLLTAAKLPELILEISKRVNETISQAKGTSTLVSELLSSVKKGDPLWDL